MSKKKAMTMDGLREFSKKILIFAILILFCAPSYLLSQTIEDDDCLTCHEDYNLGLSSTSHQLSNEITKVNIKIGCTSCHSGGAVHMEDPSVDNIGNPLMQSAQETEKTCTSCHQPHKGIKALGFDPHFRQDFSCTSCHQIHSSEEHLLKDEEGSFCSNCHVAAANEFRKNSNHPLNDGVVTCISCHDFTGKLNLNFGHGNNSNCYQCHPEQSGPFIHEHEAVSSFGTQGEGCISCHNPHGSPNNRLLVQPGDRLCQQCHSTPPLHFTQHNGIATEFECTECHSAIHGSYTHGDLLDPQLSMKIGGEADACFCHVSGN